MWGHTDRRELLKSNYLKYCTVRQTMLFSNSGASFLKLDASRSCRHFVRDLKMLKIHEKLWNTTPLRTQTLSLQLDNTRKPTTQRLRQ